jgi:NDP-sugar pyrophosphorylase family protein
MPVADHPILEIVLHQLASRGFDNVTISLGHLGSLIEAVVGDGSRLGARVNYVREYEPLGTIGPVRLVEDLAEPFLVMNGDLLTDFDYRQFMDEHVRSDAMISVGVYCKPVSISLGVFEFGPDGRVDGFQEKPTLSFPCSMGIYAMDPAVLDVVPAATRFGFDDLMRECLARDVHVRAHLHHGIWLDIGRHEDYEQATTLLSEHRDRLLPRGALVDVGFAS